MLVWCLTRLYGDINYSTKHVHTHDISAVGGFFLLHQAALDSD